MSVVESKESRIISLMRHARTTLYWGFEPLDFIARKVNRMAHYPPIALRRHVGPLGSMDGVGTEFVTYFKLLLDLQEQDRVLDLGCGCGLFELALEASGWRGPLVGVDIHGPCIRWAQRKLTARVPSFRFIHADIYNAAYWAGGRLSAAEWFRQFPENGFQIILAKSLFTHMLPQEMETYLSEVANRLSADGRALLTFFLLNGQQQSLEKAGKNQMTFHSLPGQTACRVRRVEAPTAAVAYDENHLLSAFARHGLKVKGQIRYGTWSGRSDGLSFQDLVVVVKNTE